MTEINVVFRVDAPGTSQEQWSTYSFPYGIYVAGASLDEARSEFREAAAFALPDFDPTALVEHVERPIRTAPSTYLRVALDRRVRDRDDVVRLMEDSLGVRSQRDDFLATVPMSAAGDAVMISCLPEDRLGWLFRQIADQDGVGLFSAGPVTTEGRFVWWSFIVGHQATFTGTKPTETLAAAGLTEESTISDFMRANASSTGRRLVAAGH